MIQVRQNKKHPVEPPYDIWRACFLCLVPFVDIYYMIKLGKSNLKLILVFVAIQTVTMFFIPYYLIYKLIQIYFFIRKWIVEYNVDISGFVTKRSWNKHHFESPFEFQVWKKLTERGYKVHTQVVHYPQEYRVDLAVVHPFDSQIYILGIECDGATYHSSEDVRAYDRERQKTLESRGWFIERIWSTDWWDNPIYEINRIVKRVEELAST